MNTEEALAVVRNRAATADQLIGLLGKSLEVDRVLAGHPNATSEMLDELMYRESDDGGYEIEIRRLILRNGNVSIDAFKGLAPGHVDEALQNPALESLVAREPGLLLDLPCLLEHEQCPAVLIDLAMKADSRPLQFSLMRNPALSIGLRQQLNAESFIKDAADRLEEFLAAQQSEDDRRYVAAYIELCRPQDFSIPIYRPFDAKDPAHRLSDQVICGAPFTSQAWTWPADSGGDAMQPVAQINLAQAGKSLDENLGDGLLQVWMSVKPGSGKPGSWDPLLRVIPRGGLSEPPDDFVPDGAPWNADRSDDDSCECIFSLGPGSVPSARVEWLPAGKLYPSPLHVMDEWCEKNTKFRERRKEQLSERIEGIGLPMASRSYLDVKTSAIRLGGYPHGSGNEADLGYWGGNPERMLLYVSEDVGIFCLAITYQYGADGSPVFRARISVDK